MKNRAIAVAALFLALLSALFGCARHTDWLEVFRPAFEAEIDGSWHDQPFSALVAAEKAPAEGAREVTVTFYAPKELAGTVLKQAGDGTVTLTAGELTLQTDAFDDIFTLFPAAAEVSEVTLTDEGHTALLGEGFSLTLLSDGTPYRATRGALSVTVVRFESK